MTDLNNFIMNYDLSNITPEIINIIEQKLIALKQESKHIDKFSRVNPFTKEYEIYQRGFNSEEDYSVFLNIDDVIENILLRLEDRSLSGKFMIFRHSSTKEEKIRLINSLSLVKVLDIIKEDNENKQNSSIKK